MPIVSVIINCYNGELYLKETLDSLAAQTMSDFELIFWDNCSTDCTPDIARTFDNRLRYFRADCHTSLNEARNQAIVLAKSNYIAFLDSDDIWHKDKLKLQLEFMTNNPECGICFTNVEHYDMRTGEKKIHLTKDYGRSIGFSEFMGQYNYTFSSYMIRRNALESLDTFFDDRLDYAGDFDFMCRLSYHWKAAFLPEVLVTYRIHPQMTTIKVSKTKGMVTEFKIVLEKFHKMIPNLEKEYPLVYRKLSYMIDYITAKKMLEDGTPKNARNLLRPYLDVNLNTKFCYGLSLLPPPLSKWLYKKLASNSLTS